MYRVMYLMKRNAKLSPRQFRDHYETTHRLLGEEMLNGYALSYERYYLSPMEQGGADPVFDVVTQICFPDRAAYDRCITAFMNNAKLLKGISDDGDIMVDKSKTAHVESQDDFSKLAQQPRSDTIFRTVWFARRRDGMTHEECKSYYLHKHRLIGEYMMNGFAYTYDRHFLHRIKPDDKEPPYTFIMEMNFPSRARYEAMGKAIMSDPTLVQFVGEDEQRFIDRSSAVHYAGEMCASALQPLAIAA
jgi:hypothetical protein